ncbi:tRNA (adenosine(37)-N6)-threonylcarbamoyltransferase complex ATPase subunit type 1 TsaE [Corynebacterium lowii]|uniref:tRNA threonylcarbamoyladenosine biosynthesis protein TsaE n=1 Tax=Corynebacterium lowii TaxID=1544413 RepID=A0A0Q0UGE4_9CORY|nr:tRNA (adenosine(37)-N6)-threonylcarbamoyltransferase complex ATPase subunit type 1 TsaE [Corynebacterium lowii]KQB87433.1 tRNA threonylcarbamoyladenosine biosynthesis protein TsaE [Corynebacterium lowii]MDP9851975.1 tRNA threonylcarbamoyladenosine biosynthesis protein TsaE [Corynebacterium lowii]
MRESFPAQGSLRCEQAEDTQALGEQLGAALEAGDVVLLDGPLGAGKTTLTQGIARGMGVRGRVTSPTFTIAREHRHPQGGPALIHVDAYRLLGEEAGSGAAGTADPVGALDSLDLDSELESAVVVAEWGGGLVEQIAGEYLWLHLDRTTAVEEDPDSEARIISWQWRGGA